MTDIDYIAHGLEDLMKQIEITHEVIEKLEIKVDRIQKINDALAKKIDGIDEKIERLMAESNTAKNTLKSM